MNGKSWYQSKMLWTNITAIIGALGAVAMGEVSWQVAVPTVALAVVNFLLRIVTKQPIE